MSAYLPDDERRCMFRGKAGRCQRAKVHGYGDRCSKPEHREEKTMPTKADKGSTPNPLPSAPPAGAEERMLRYFTFEHLPMHLQDVSAPFFFLATDICNALPSSPERTVCLRKLLEAKDCAVRAKIDTVREG